MYLESIKSVNEAEERLRLAKEQRALDARKEIADAQAAGKKQITEAAARADENVREYLAEVTKKAEAQAAEKAENIENKKAILRARADNNMERAASFIAERIVKG